MNTKILAARENVYKPGRLYRDSGRLKAAAVEKKGQALSLAIITLMSAVYC